MIAQNPDSKEQQPGPIVLNHGVVPPPAYPDSSHPAAGTYYPQPSPQVGTPMGTPGQQPQNYPQNFQPQSDAARLGEQYRAELMAACAQGRHDRTTKFGVCGIITAILCFPIGLIALCIDNEERCARCGVRL